MKYLRSSATRVAVGLTTLVLLGALGASSSALAAPSTPAPSAAASQASPAAPTAAAASAPVAAAPANLSVSAQTLQAVATLAQVSPEDVKSTPVTGVFEVRRGSDIVYMTQDGQYVFTGDLYQVAGRNDLTEVRRRDLRKRLIDTIPESDMVVFSPAQPKYTVTVFTDVDCSYCRALHRQIADYNRLGVRVRYVFFPRTGPNTESWFKAEQVWCSADRKAALTRAKLGEPLDAKRCANTPVAREYELGKAIGLEGTPGVIASNGTLVGGYLPPDQMVEQLKQLQP